MAADADAAAAVAVIAVTAVAAIGVDRTTVDGEAAAVDAVAAGAVCAAAAFGRQAVIFAAVDGEAADAVDAAAAVTTGEVVVAIQLNRGIAAAGHTHGGFVPAAGVDVQVVESDVHVALRSIDGDCVLIRRAGDDGVGVLHILLIPL